MTCVEDRPLTRIELTLLLAEAPEAEVKNLISYLNDIKRDAFDFFNSKAVYQFGLIINERPVYFAYITKLNGKYELWTVVNSNVHEQFSLYKHSKRSLKKALETFSPIYATMETHNKKNIDWVKKMGFVPMEEMKDLITFKIQKQKE